METHDLARKMQDEERTQQAREAVVSTLPPKKALHQFRGYRGDQVDEVGVEMVIQNLAKKHGVDPEQIRAAI